jgi:ABC-type Zn uptake system ZnuABC Zn-binding protein ZnuA
MRIRRETAVSVALTALVAAGLAGCGKYPDPWEKVPGSPRVLVSIPPLYCFARNVAGENAAIVSLCTTTGPHHYNYQFSDEFYLRRANLLLANGLTLDDRFTEKLHQRNPRLRYNALGDHLLHDLLIHTGEEGGKHVHADGTVCEHGEHDPHVWLGIPQAMKMVEMIRDELQKVDPPHADDYTANAAAYLAKLRDLHAYGTKLLKDKKDRRLITFHESLAYFADPRSFDLDIIGVIMLGPGDEPAAKRLAELVDLCYAKKVCVIAVEPQYPKTTSAHVLQKELRRKGCPEVELVEIDPLETATPEELASPDWYVRKMKENLDHLARHLP